MSERGARVGSGLRFAVLAAVVALLCGLVAPAAAAPAVDGYGTDAWWYKAMKLDQAHETSTGQGVTIAVIDDPIDPDVPELRGQDVTAVANVCGGPPAGTGPIADHGTRMVVDLVGSGRGTLPGGVGVAGIAPGAEVRTYAVDASAGDGPQCNIGRGAAFARAIDAALDDDVQLVAIPAGSANPSPAERAAVQRAMDAGVVVVASAGNGPQGDRSVIYPAAYPGVVAVAAVDRGAQPWDGNVDGNRKAFVISAPGVDVPTGGFDGQRWRSDGIATGTSESAVFVAGGLALVAAEYPKATGNQLIQHLIRNTGGEDDFDFDLDFGYGIMSVTKMLASDPTQWPDRNPLVEPAKAPAASDAGSTDSAGSGPPPGGAAAQASGSGAGSGERVAAAGGDGGGVPGWLWAVAAVALLIVVAAVVLVIVFAGRRSDPAASGSLAGLVR